MLIILTNPNGTPLAQVELLRPGERSQADDLAWTASPSTRHVARMTAPSR
jgi:hypothetical protein